MILSTHPASQAVPLASIEDDARIDQIKEMKQFPEIWSDYESLTSGYQKLKDDIKTGNGKSIARLIESSEEVFMNVKSRSPKLIHAIILTICKDIQTSEVSLKM